MALNAGRVIPEELWLIVPLGGKRNCSDGSGEAAEDDSGSGPYIFCSSASSSPADQVALDHSLHGYPRVDWEWG